MLPEHNASPPKVPQFPQLFSGMLALSIALVGSAYIAGNALKALRSNDVLTVIGSSTRPIRADYVIWRSSVASQQPTLPQAYQELKRHNERVSAYLQSKNIPADAIALSAIDTQPIPETNANGYQTGRNLAYRLTQRFEVRSKDVDGISAIAQSSTDLINEGIPFTSEPPEYLYTQLSQLRVEMISEATKDAKARGEAIVNVSGSRLGTIRKAETDVFQITARYSTEVSNSGSYNTTSIDKDIRAVVAITFAVE
ncbi:SIMPL domain-containing protein [Pseudanabaena mucicola]|uniref:SIMPL domain-containing protein n=1 Tax=Pseudanabaena mucicola FACHB-723 TaxID=2692860 RepID=A0ABR7ZXH1_9CYAN|nr:SIMPL domain-containing protein [Pseudanabaena mucicola]MBD2188663.1 SIMPL domain-containing protein [Pseudanabaena mucicola FACHB-723]